MTIVAGTIFPFGGTTVPAGYLLCDGQAVSRTSYASLFGVIGTTYGAGDGSTTFNLPDLTGGVSPPPTVVLTYLIATDDSTDDGTVTSVGLSTDAGWFAVSNSPVTTSGTLAIDVATGLAPNAVLATPDGVSGTVGLRSLVGSDLPDPGTASKGGIRSLAPVTSHWINAISTSGVPGTSRPSFGDISGVATAAQLPNPTTSAKGGVQAFTAVTNQWIKAISTSGVPSAAQPAFSNIAGTIANSQLPANTNLSTVGTVVDGGGFVLTTGQKGYVYCPYAGTIVAATLIADAAGSIVIDVWKAPFNTIPIDANSITASTPPALSAEQTSQNTTLSGWTKTVAANDVFGFNIDSVGGIRRIALVLTIARS